eukprot:4599959-Alexandrium_andersonii.AAC.1
MSASLVGSEMCIRDRPLWKPPESHRKRTKKITYPNREVAGNPNPVRLQPVSYTHLTLPTICSV